MGLLRTSILPGEDPGRYTPTMRSASCGLIACAHQILAINRGEAQGVLKVGVDVSDRDWREAVEIFPTRTDSPLSSQLEAAKEDSAARLLLPAIERDIRRLKTEEAESHAIHVFASNLRALLLQPPLLNHTILGIDPGYRTAASRGS